MSGKKIESVLDLPMEEQLRHAAEEGKTHEQWVADTKDFFARSDAFLKKIQAFEREAKEKGLPVNRTFQARIDSGNPV